MPGVLGEVKSPDRSPAAPSFAHRTMQSILTGLALLPLTAQHPSGKGLSLQALEGGGGVGPSTSAKLQKFGETKTKTYITTAGRWLHWQPPPLLSAPCLTCNTTAQHHQGTTRNEAGPETGTVLNCMPEQAGPAIGHPKMSPEYVLWSKQGMCQNWDPRVELE